MKDFFKWIFNTQLVLEKAPMWQEFFKNFITLLLIFIYAIQIFRGLEVSKEYMLILGTIIGFYFGKK